MKCTSYFVQSNRPISLSFLRLVDLFPSASGRTECECVCEGQQQQDTQSSVCLCSDEQNEPNRSRTADGRMEKPQQLHFHLTLTCSRSNFCLYLHISLQLRPRSLFEHKFQSSFVFSCSSSAQFSLVMLTAHLKPSNVLLNCIIIPF